MIGPNTHALDPIEVRFTDAGCHAVFGDRVASLNERLDAEGFSGSLPGWFAAAAQGETTQGEGLAEQLEARDDELERRVRDGTSGAGRYPPRPGRSTRSSCRRRPSASRRRPSPSTAPVSTTWTPAPSCYRSPARWSAPC